MRTRAKVGRFDPYPGNLSAGEQLEIVLSRLPLTRSEARVALHLPLGFEDSEIAQHLGISLSTAKAHVARAILRLQQQNRSGVAGCIVAALWAGELEAERRSGR